MPVVGVRRYCPLEALRLLVGGLGVAVAAPDVGVAAGAGAWPVQAAKVMNIDTSAQIGSLVIRVLLSFCLSIGA